MSNHIDHYEALFDSTYLRWFDLDGKSVTVTISKIERDVELTMRGGVKSKKPVIHFKETPKPLVMNKTNMASIADLHGPAPSKWIGRQVTLFQSQTDMYDKDLRKMVTRECIRVRASAQAENPLRERIVGLRDFMGAVSADLKNWEALASWAGVLLDIKGLDPKGLGELDLGQVERLEAAARDAAEGRNTNKEME